MKVFIGIGNSHMNGYLNIDPLGGEGKQSLDFRNLDPVCDTAECTEICAPDILDYIHISEVIDVLRNWVSKLRHGGTLIVGGFDAYEVCCGVVSGQLDTIEFNNIIYGVRPLHPIVKCGMFTRHDIESILRELGLQIIHKRVESRKFTVEAKRG